MSRYEHFHLTQDLLKFTLSLRHSGNARGQHAKECEEAGMDSTIVKPYDFKEMLAKLDSLQIA